MARARRRSEVEWAEILDAYERSGQTRTEFCRRRRLGLTSFNRWRARLREQQDDGFVELEPGHATASEAGWELDVSLPNGVQLRFRG